VRQMVIGSREGGGERQVHVAGVFRRQEVAMGREER